MKLIVSCSLTDHRYCVFAVFWLRSTRMCWAGSLQLWSSIRRPWCRAFPSSTCVTWRWWWVLHNINIMMHFIGEIAKINNCVVNRLCCMCPNKSKASSVCKADTVCFYWASSRHSLIFYLFSPSHLYIR